MMLDSPHTSAPMLMRGNALVLKTPVENVPRTSVEKHLSWSSDSPPPSARPKMPIVIAGQEQCDDGNWWAYDGYSGSCTVECGWDCIGGMCTGICGEREREKKTNRWQEGLLRAERSMLFPKN